MTKVPKDLVALPPELWASDVEVVLLDCDGTLVNSDPALDRLVPNHANAAFRNKGLCSKRHTARANRQRFHGKPFDHLFPLLAQERDLHFTPAELREIYVAFERRKVEVLREEACPTPGIVSTLYRLQAAGKICAVVSSSSLQAIQACLAGAGLTEFFPTTHIFSAVDCPAVKPAPDVYLRAMKQLGVKAARCLAVEDSASGIQSAVVAGLRVVAYGGCVAKALQAAHESQCRQWKIATYMRHWIQFPGYLGLPGRTT